MVLCSGVGKAPHRPNGMSQALWARGPHMYSILTFFVDPFELNSVLLAEGSVLGVTSLVITGGWGGP